MNGKICLLTRALIFILLIGAFCCAQTFEPRLVSVNLDKTTATIRVDPREMYTTTCTEREENIRVAVITRKLRSTDRLRYAATGGRIIGEGPNIVWNFASTRPGKYTLTVELERDDKIIERSVPSVVELKECEWDPPPCECPTVMVSGSVDAASSGDTLAFEAKIGGGASADPTYNWTVSGGTIVSGQETLKLVVATSAESGGEVTATIELKGVCDNSCQPQASKTVILKKK